MFRFDTPEDPEGSPGEATRAMYNKLHRHKRHHLLIKQTPPLLESFFYLLPIYIDELGVKLAPHLCGT